MTTAHEAFPPNRADSTSPPPISAESPIPSTPTDWLSAYPPARSLSLDPEALRTFELAYNIGLRVEPEGPPVTFTTVLAALLAVEDATSRWFQDESAKLGPIPDLVKAEKGIAAALARTDLRRPVALPPRLSADNQLLTASARRVLLNAGRLGTGRRRDPRSGRGTWSHPTYSIHPKITAGNSIPGKSKKRPGASPSSSGRRRPSPSKRGPSRAGGWPRPGRCRRSCNRGSRAKRSTGPAMSEPWKSWSWPRVTTPTARIAGSVFPRPSLLSSSSRRRTNRLATRFVPCCGRSKKSASNTRKLESDTA